MCPRGSPRTQRGCRRCACRPDRDAAQPAVKLRCAASVLRCHTPAHPTRTLRPPLPALHTPPPPVARRQARRGASVQDEGGVSAVGPRDSCQLRLHCAERRLPAHPAPRAQRPAPRAEPRGFGRTSTCRSRAVAAAAAAAAAGLGGSGAPPACASSSIDTAMPPWRPRRVTPRRRVRMRACTAGESERGGVGGEGGACAGGGKAPDAGHSGTAARARRAAALRSGGAPATRGARRAATPRPAPIEGGRRPCPPRSAWAAARARAQGRARPAVAPGAVQAAGRPPRRRRARRGARGANACAGARTDR
jgi:hypothetical protein